jgi:hypothetical protein
VTKVFHYKGKTIEVEAQPSMADRVNLATYARTIADITYRALGDFGEKSDLKANASAKPRETVPPITIILPKEIALPRAERARLAELAAQQRLEQGNGETPSPNN